MHFYVPTLWRYYLTFFTEWLQIQEYYLQFHFIRHFYYNLLRNYSITPRWANVVTFLTICSLNTQVNAGIRQLHKIKKKKLKQNNLSRATPGNTASTFLKYVKVLTRYFFIIVKKKILSKKVLCKFWDKEKSFPKNLLMKFVEQLQFSSQSPFSFFSIILEQNFNSVINFYHDYIPLINKF